MYGLETGREVRKDRGGSEGRRKEVRERVEMEGEERREGRKEGRWVGREGRREGGERGRKEGGERGRKERKGGRVRRDEHIQHLYGQDMPQQHKLPQQLQSMAEPFSAGCALQRALQSAACERRGLC